MTEKLRRERRRSRRRTRRPKPSPCPGCGIVAEAAEKRLGGWCASCLDVARRKRRARVGERLLDRALLDRIETRREPDGSEVDYRVMKLPPARRRVR